jgi:hypothetical protein
MKKLPTSIEKYILTFLIPPSNQIVFINHIKKNCRDYYSERYQKAYINNCLITNDNYYLSRIIKKNNKHRYYKTLQISDTIECEYGDRVIISESFEYQSEYIGKNIDIALFRLFF